MGKLGFGWRGALALAIVLGAPSAALAHTVMLTPPPRDVGVAGNDGHKTGPCGGVARTNKCTKYAVGATIPVKWMETVPHEGCFQWLVSKSGDTNFVTLTQITDPAGGTGMVYNDNVKLPANFSCENCTLAVRQLMIGTCAPDAAANSTSAGDTYFSCADVRIGDFPDAAPCDPAVEPDAGPDAGTTPGSDGGPTTVPTDGGGKTVDGGDNNADPTGGRPNLHAGDGGGCSVALGATSGVSFAVTAGLFGLALLRRRRKR